MNNEPRKKIGLAISGGFIRPAAAIGVIEVFEENGISIDLVSGCSAGAGVAAAYAAGTLSQLKDRLVTGSRREYWEVVFDPTLPRNGLLKGERTREFIHEWMGDRTFADMHTKLFLTATDLHTMKPVILSEGSVAEAVRAAVSVPGMFVPVAIRDQLLADGGNFNLIPSQVLYDHGADYVVAVDTSQRPNFITRGLAAAKHTLRLNRAIRVTPLASENPGILRVIARAAGISSSQIHNFSHTSYRYDILIKPHLHGIKRWNIGKVRLIIEEGRTAALEALPQIKKELGL